MSWFKDTLTSSIGRKLIMAITGLGLIGFLLVHLIGNLALLAGDGGISFNEYAHSMKGSPVILIGEVVIFSGFLFHIIDGIGLVISNKKARPVSYGGGANAKTSTGSKIMGPLGIVITVFFILHLVDFFYRAKIADDLGLDANNIADLYALVVEKFQSPAYVAIYVVSMIAIGIHLNHGFQSAFQTFGLNHLKYTPIIKFIGTAYAVVVPGAFAFIPLFFYFTK
ncbi:MAG: succinate dehydrogenase cytochrome b subunit [Cytophagales bacterium]|nr:succinate dehydrogenase cytochrome b subunit [Cytophagales bacterium]